MASSGPRREKHGGAYGYCISMIRELQELSFLGSNLTTSEYLRSMCQTMISLPTLLSEF